MAEPYFNFTFDTINNAYIYSTPMFSNKLPVKNGLIQRFRGADYNTTTKVFVNSVNNLNNIPASVITGAPTVVSYSNNTSRTNNAINSFSALRMNSTDAIQKINDSQTMYTLFTVARYQTNASNSNKGRIFQGANVNVVYGFHNTHSGVAYYGDWITPQTDNFGTDWVISTSKPNIYRGNGTRIGSGSGPITYLPELAINAGLYPGEASDCEIADIIIYNRELSDTEIQQTELYLSGLYGIYGANLVGITSGSPSFNTTDKQFGTQSISLSSNQFVTVPNFNFVDGTGVSFSLWFKTMTISDNNSGFPRIFQFGIESLVNDIMMLIHNNKLSIQVHKKVNNVQYICEIYDILPCNDNVWRHVVWTINSDGSVWKLYVNGSLFTTYTSATNSTIYPMTLTTTINYIGKSLNSADVYYNGLIDEFKMFMTTLSDADVTSLYTSNVISTTQTIQPAFPFYINNIPMAAPIGSILAYTNAGTAPPGWIFCNGVQRLNTNGIYNNLLSMLIGTLSTNNYYTPPNLTTYYVIGSTAANDFLSLSETNVNQTAITLTSDKIPSLPITITKVKDNNHSHGITDPGHKHLIGYKNSTEQNSVWLSRATDHGTSKQYTGYSHINDVYPTYMKSGYGTKTGMPTMDIIDAVSFASGNSNLSGATISSTYSNSAQTTIDITPPYYTVMFIIKY